MKVNHFLAVSQEPVDMEGATGCKVRWLVGKTDGAPNFAMRQFEVAPGGHTPRHFHPYEHEVYVLDGEGTVCEGETVHPLKAGEVIYVAPNEVHQFCCTGSRPLRFLCVVPHVSAANATVTPCGTDAAGTSSPECAG